MEKCKTCLQFENFCTCADAHTKHQRLQREQLARERGTKLEAKPEIGQPVITEQISKDIEELNKVSEIPMKEEKSFFKGKKKRSK